MTNDEQRPRLTRIADARIARRAELTDDGPAPTTAATVRDAAFAPGDRVFDVSTGTEGTVTDVRRTGADSDPVIAVALVGAGVVARRPADLIPRPPRPAGRS